MTGFDVVGFGALNLDRLYRVDQLANAEEESFIKSSTESCGGSAANTIVGLARLGCKVGFIGKIGRDVEGALLIGDFVKEGVDTAGVIQSGQGDSGQVMGFVDSKAQRALYIKSGINDTISFKEIALGYIAQTKFLHLTSFVGDESFQTQNQLLKSLPENVLVSFDPGALYARKGFDVLKPVITKSHVVMPNSKELKLMTGMDDYCIGADFLISQGVKVVAVKLGSEGCYITDGRERLRVEAFNVKAVDTTGAGDAFCAGFLYGLLNGRNLQDCGTLGNFVASRCVMKSGARAGLPYLKDLPPLH